jgi:hypothetical protein
MQNEQLHRQADRIKRSFQKRKQKVVNPSGSKMHQKKKPVIEKSPSLGSFKSDEDDESDQDTKSTEEIKSVDTNVSHVSIGKKSPTSFLPTPKQVVRARRTSSNLKPQVRSITLPANTKALIDRISYSPPVGASPNKRHRVESDSPVDPSTTLHDDPSFPTASYSSPPSLPPSSSSPSSSKRPRRSSGSNIVSSSSSFVSPPTLTVYHGAIRPDQFMVNPMVNILPLSSSSHTRPEASITSSSPQSINSDFQFDITSLGTEQTFYNYDHQHHSSATISAIPAVRMPIVNNDMPSYVPNDFLASAILEDSDDRKFYKK